MEASQRFPIRLTGMALVNAFVNSKQNGGMAAPQSHGGVGSPRQPDRAGATMRQTYHRPGISRAANLPWAAMCTAPSSWIFIQGAAPLQEWIRLRTGVIQVDWATSNIKVGVDKPIFNPRDPDSLAQVGLSPLTGAGNLWLWMPQIRLEQDLAFTGSSGIRAQIGAVETHEVNPYGAPVTTGKVETVRPGVEGRVEAYHKLDDVRKLEFAVGFHASTTHASGFSVPSNLVSLDWFFNPLRRVEFSGAFFTGQNVANLGTGAINQGYYVTNYYAEEIVSRGGWVQVNILTFPSLDVLLFTGQLNYQSDQLHAGSVTMNLVYGGNLFFRIAPNVIVGPEITQIRSYYIGLGNRINNHYDLAFAYLF